MLLCLLCTLKWQEFQLPYVSSRDATRLVALAPAELVTNTSAALMHWLVAGRYSYVQRVSSGCVGPTADYKIGFPSSVRKSTYVINLAPVSLVYGRASDTSKTSKEPFGKNIQRISRYPFFLIDNPTAGCGLEAKEIIHGY